MWLQQYGMSRQKLGTKIHRHQARLDRSPRKPIVNVIEFNAQTQRYLQSYTKKTTADLRVCEYCMAVYNMHHVWLLFENWTWRCYSVLLDTDMQ